MKKSEFRSEFFEKYRQLVLSELGANSFSAIMKNYWMSQIQYHFPINSSKVEDLFILGDQLGTIFKSTSKIDEDTRGQGVVVTAGHVFECLITWYVNLGLIGTNTIAIKYKKDLIPEAIRHALTVTYGNHNDPSNSEADIIVISFDDLDDVIFKRFESTDANQLTKEDFYHIFNEIVNEHFSKIRVNVIQCKTNWNDNAQIPMAWDLIYSATQFRNDKIKVGIKGRKVHDLKSFQYSFVTVPSQSASVKYKITSVAVQRVNMLSGHNFWCRPTEKDKDDSSRVIAYSISEIFELNFKDIFKRDQFLTRLNQHDGIKRLFHDFS